MHATSNDTTTRIGQSQATVIADSICNGHRITTLELLYPRYIHSELMTHRMFSRNASSSRATPIEVLVQDARCPVFFDQVLKNKPGMQGGVPLNDDEIQEFRKEWDSLANYVADWVKRMSETYNIHKQTLNRALEPFTRIRVLVTATDWDNFFDLRTSNAAQPEMICLATAMRTAMGTSQPKTTTVHLPYIDAPQDFDIDSKVSVARCARVSYGRLDGRLDNVEDDIKLYDRLWQQRHLSPFEHVAVAEEGRFANYNGWKSLRFTAERVL